MVNQITSYSFDPKITYHRKYVNLFFENHADMIEGRVLDLGSMKSHRDWFNNISDNMSEYFSADIVPNDGLSVVADGTSLPFQDDSFDTIILMEVVEHIPPTKLGQLFVEVYRCLKPTGNALFTTPFITPIHGSPPDYFDYGRLGPAGFEDHLSKAGFETISITQSGRPADVLLHYLYHSIWMVTPAVLYNLNYWFLLVHYATHTVDRLADMIVPSRSVWGIGTFAIASPNRRNKHSESS